MTSPELIKGDYITARNACAEHGAHLMHLKQYDATTTPGEVDDYNSTELMQLLRDGTVGGCTGYNPWRIGLRGNNKDGEEDKGPFYWDYGDERAPVLVKENAILVSLAQQASMYRPYREQDGFSVFVIKNDKISFIESVPSRRERFDRYSLGSFIIQPGLIPYFCEKHTPFE
jgi:hypothetical protein